MFAVSSFFKFVSKFGNKDIKTFSSNKIILSQSSQRTQRKFHESREFTRIFWNELWLLAIGVWQNKTASAESQRLKANSQSKKKKDTCRYVRFVEHLLRALQFILSVCDLCERLLNLTLKFLPLTGTGSTANWYW